MVCLIYSGDFTLFDSMSGMDIFKHYNLGRCLTMHESEIYFVYVITILVFRKPYKTMHYRLLLPLVRFSKAEYGVGG